jgi:hypothetical protein
MDHLMLTCSDMHRSDTLCKLAGRDRKGIKASYISSREKVGIFRWRKCTRPRARGDKTFPHLFSRSKEIESSACMLKLCGSLELNTDALREIVHQYSRALRTHTRIRGPSEYAQAYKVVRDLVSSKSSGMEGIVPYHGCRWLDGKYPSAKYSQISLR